MGQVIESHPTWKLFGTVSLLSLNLTVFDFRTVECGRRPGMTSVILTRCFAELDQILVVVRVDSQRPIMLDVRSRLHAVECGVELRADDCRIEIASSLDYFNPSGSDFSRSSSRNSVHRCSLPSLVRTNDFDGNLTPSTSFQSLKVMW